MTNRSERLVSASEGAGSEAEEEMEVREEDTERAGDCREHTLSGFWG